MHNVDFIADHPPSPLHTQFDQPGMIDSIARRSLASPLSLVDLGFERMTESDLTFGDIFRERENDKMHIPWERVVCSITTECSV